MVCTLWCVHFILGTGAFGLVSLVKHKCVYPVVCTPWFVQTLFILGKGAFGLVSLVKHKQNGTLFALKQLQKKQLVQTKQCQVTSLGRHWDAILTPL